MNKMPKDFEGPSIRPVRDLRNNYAEIAQIIKGHRPVFITTQGKGEAVIINIEDYADYEAYLYEKYVSEKLAEAEAAAACADAQWHTLDDVDSELRGKLNGV
jgi:PHD/YefM family antitoxin component YafN of YafNO toxin-antitoxin module